MGVPQSRATIPCHHQCHALPPDPPFRLGSYSLKRQSNSWFPIQRHQEESMGTILTWKYVFQWRPHLKSSFSNNQYAQLYTKRFGSASIMGHVDLAETTETAELVRWCSGSLPTPVVGWSGHKCRFRLVDLGAPKSTNHRSVIGWFRC
jgi:hypothetical protein